MNKKLFLKVKELCKDTGLSEKYLQAITEKMSGSLEDDSTDETAIEGVANLIAEVAKESQGEATRWASKKNQKKPKPNEEEEEEEEEEEKGKGRKKGAADNQASEELAALRKEIEEMKAERAKGDRAKAIADAMEKHKIPAKFRSRFAKSISDDEDIDAAVAQIKQDFITDGLMTETGGKKEASEKQVDDAANALLESITAK